MVRIAFPSFSRASLAAAAAAALLAACGTTQPTVGVAPRIAEQELPYRPGTGTVQSVNELAGGEVRLGIRMSDGTLQYVDLDSRDVTTGRRVELTPEREIRML